MECMGENVEEPSTDERYTVAYIEREASILLRYLADRGPRPFGRSAFRITALDSRIIKRWGLR
jgi:hypothetical protein